MAIVFEDKAPIIENNEYIGLFTSAMSAIISLVSSNPVKVEQMYQGLEPYNTLYAMQQTKQDTSLAYPILTNADPNNYSQFFDTSYDILYSTISSYALYIEFDTVNNVLDNWLQYVTTKNFMFERNSNPPDESKVGYEWDPISLTGIREKYGNYIVITKLNTYDNKDDGNISKENPRVPLPGGTNGAGQTFVLRYYIDKFRPLIWSRQTGYHDLLVRVPTVMASSGAIRSYDQSTSPNIINPISTAYTTYLSKRIGITPIIFTNDEVPSEGRGATMLCLLNKNSIESYFNAFKIPFTFSKDEILYSNTKDFGDYDPGGQPDSGEGGGDGDGNNTSDDIIVTPPTISNLSGLNNFYVLNRDQVNSLGQYLWTSTFVDDIKLLFNNPAESVISCTLFPFDLATHDPTHVGDISTITIGNVETTVNGRPLNANYNCLFDLGTFDIKEYYGSAMDYSPYTNIAIYLPYIGIKDLNVNEVMNTNLKVQYAVDVTSGASVAMIWANTKLLYTFSGKIGLEVPINSTNANEQKVNLTLGLVSGGIATTAGLVTGNPIAFVGGALSTAKSVSSSQLHVNKGAIGTPQAGLYTPQYCYLIITRPIQSLPADFGEVAGFPSNITRPFNNIAGYTEISDVIIDDIIATDTEKKEIKTLLENGVIFN